MLKDFFQADDAYKKFGELGDGMLLVKVLVGVK